LCHRRTGDHCTARRHLNLFVAIWLSITHRTSSIPHHSTILLRVSLRRVAY